MKLCIDEMRKKKGLSQKQLSDISGVARTYISEIESGKYTPGLEIAYMISKALDCTIDELIPETEKKALSLKVKENKPRSCDYKRSTTRERRQQLIRSILSHSA